jgi:hypothetical protein
MGKSMEGKLYKWQYNKMATLDVEGTLIQRGKTNATTYVSSKANKQKVKADANPTLQESNQKRSKINVTQPHKRKQQRFTLDDTNIVIQPQHESISTYRFEVER